MFSFLKDHPFAVEAFFESSLVLSYVAPKVELVRLVPACLELDTFDDRWAFIAAAMVETRALRPRGLPAIFGNDFFLIGYRVFVRFTDSRGKRSRGLYILGSATDKRRMQFFGNIFTHYNYKTTDINKKTINGVTEITSDGSRFKVRYEEPGDSSDVILPAGSPFTDWKEARRFAGPLPFTFTYDPAKKSVVVIEGVRQNWTPLPVGVLEHNFSFLDDLHVPKMKLANAFMVRGVPYCWKKGRVEPIGIQE